MFNPITPEGYDILKKKLRHLIEHERPSNIREIMETRALGDLSENAEYHAAKSQQRDIERQIVEIKNTLDSHIIVDCKDYNSSGVATFGCTVHLYDYNEQKTLVLRLLNEVEVTLFTGAVSVSSPLGQRIVGKAVNEKFSVNGHEFLLQEVHYV